MKTKREPRVISTAEEAAKLEMQECTCCGKKLTGKRIAWLELDQRTNTYHDFGGVPESKSQGWFPFGITCAKSEIAKAAG